MKKLMIAAAIVCAAVVSQAATFDWSVDGGLKDASGNDASGLFAFGFFGSDTAGKAPVMTVDQAWAMIQAEFPGYTIGDRTGVADGGAVMIGSSEVADAQKDSTISGFIILVDQTPADIENWKPTQYSVIQGGLAGTQEIGNAGGAYTFQFTAAEQGEWKSVPEPTSGLLLLLGVAGLALKRKRA